MILVILHLVVLMPSATMVSVLVYRNIKEIHMLVVDPNVFSMLTVPGIGLVYRTNVLTLVRIHVLTMPYVRFIIMFQCAIVPKL